MTQASILQALIRREGRSLLQYVSEAFPWITPPEQETLARLQVLVRQEQEAVADLCHFLRKRRVAPPFLGAYPMSFTTINFVTLDYLLPLLVDTQERAIAHLDQDLSRLPDPEAHAAVALFRDLKHQHLQSLKEMWTQAQKPALVSRSP